MKTCSVCKKNLPLDMFNKQSTGKQGVRADCKDCLKRFIRSKHGVINQMYSGCISRTKKKGFTSVSFTKEELEKWVYSCKEFHTLYDKWVLEDYPTALKPSLDRLDDYKGYSLDNIRIVTTNTNVKRYYSDAINGINTKSAKPVEQYSLDGEYIRTFHSLSAAARSVNGIPSNINQVINGTYAQAYGYKWKLGA